MTFSKLIAAGVLQRFYVILFISDYDITVSGSEESYVEHNKSRYIIVYLILTSVFDPHLRNTMMTFADPEPTFFPDL